MGDGRWAALAAEVDATDQNHMLHGYLTLLSAFALKRGGFGESAASIIKTVQAHTARLNTNYKALCELPHDGSVEVGEKLVAERQQLEHWQDLTLPLLEACVAFAAMLQVRAKGDAVEKSWVEEAYSAAVALDATSNDMVTAKLGGSDEQRLVFRLSFHAASILAQNENWNESCEQALSAWSEVRKRELLGDHPSGRPHWPLEFAWAHARSSGPSDISGISIGGA